MLRPFRQRVSCLRLSWRGDLSDLEPDPTFTCPLVSSSTNSLYLRGVDFVHRPNNAAPQNFVQCTYVPDVKTGREEGRS